MPAANTNMKVITSEYTNQQGSLFGDCIHSFDRCDNGTVRSHYGDSQNPTGGFMHSTDHAGQLYNTGAGGGQPYTTETHSNAHRVWQNNSCRHTGSHDEECNWNGTHNHGSQNEYSRTTANNSTRGSSGQHVSAASDHTHIHTSSSGGMGGSSSGSLAADHQTFTDSSGTQSENQYSDHCHTTYGHTYKIHAGGDYGMHVQQGGQGEQSGGGGGNWDCHADSKAQLFGQSACYVNSATTVVLQAGTGTATITMMGDTITIKASKIILDGECHLGGQGGQPCGECGGGCASKVFVT
jgi:hypothetical protein